MKAILSLLIFCALVSVSSVHAQTIKSKLNYDVYSIDFDKKRSRKISIQANDLNYFIPIKSALHQIDGYVEFDIRNLIEFRKISNKSRYIHTDEISEIISDQLGESRLNVSLKRKYFDIGTYSFDRHIKVNILDIERLGDNLVRCHFQAQLEFPIQVKKEYQSLKAIATKVKFKFKTDRDNFFAKSKTTKLNLNLFNK